MEPAVLIGKTEIGRLERFKVTVLPVRPWTKAPSRQLLVLSNGLFHEPGKFTQIEPCGFVSLHKEIGLPLFGQWKAKFTPANALRLDNKTRRAREFLERHPQFFGLCEWRRSAQLGRCVVVNHHAPHLAGRFVGHRAQENQSDAPEECPHGPKSTIGLSSMYIRKPGLGAAAAF